MTTITDPHELEWKNSVWLSVVSACVGEISRSMGAVWIEFVGGMDVVIHFQVDDLTTQLATNARDIAEEVGLLMEPQELGNLTTQLHLETPDIALEDLPRYRWIYLAKDRP